MNKYPEHIFSTKPWETLGIFWKIQNFDPLPQMKISKGLYLYGKLIIVVFNVKNPKGEK